MIITHLNITLSTSSMAMASSRLSSCDVQLFPPLNTSNAMEAQIEAPARMEGYGIKDGCRAVGASAILNIIEDGGQMFAQLY